MSISTTISVTPFSQASLETVEDGNNSGSGQDEREDGPDVHSNCDWFLKVRDDCLIKLGFQS